MYGSKPPLPGVTAKNAQSGQMSSLDPFVSGPNCTIIVCILELYSANNNFDPVLNYLLVLQTR